MSDIPDFTGNGTNAIGQVAILERLTACLERQAVAAESIALSLSRLADRDAPPGARRRRPDERDELELRAMVLLAQQDASRINVTEIADRLGTSRRLLYKFPKFKSQLDEMRAWGQRQGKRPRKGFRRDDRSVDGENE